MSTFRDYYFSLKNNTLYTFTDEIIYSLFSDVSNYNKIELITRFDEEVKNKEKLEKYIKRIIEGEPYQYVLGYSYFLDHKFYVDNNVLIPRQETEQLVVETIKLIKEKYDHKIKVLDMCSGSGVIGISIAKECDADVTMVDISNKTNKVAENNCNLNKTKCRIIESDLFSNLEEEKYNLIISNPPYIKDESTVDKATLKNEPHIALFASPYTHFYEEIFKNCTKFLKKDGFLAFEIGEDMEDDLTMLIKKYFTNVSYKFIKDIYNKTRFLFIGFKL